MSVSWPGVPTEGMVTVTVRPPSSRGPALAVPPWIAPVRQDRFAACVAHELRAPVALQRALVEFTLADPHADAVALRAMGEPVVASCIRQQRLIEALLELVQSGHGLTRHEPVDMAEIAAAALRAHHPNDLERVPELEQAWTTGDPELLERLAANLVSNAIRHNSAGGGLGIDVAFRALD
jgi:signal transduction histidine kinase